MVFFLWSEKQNKTAVAILMKWGSWLEWRPAAKAVRGLRGWSVNTPEDWSVFQVHITSFLCSAFLHHSPIHRLESLNSTVNKKTVNRMGELYLQTMRPTRD